MDVCSEDATNAMGVLATNHNITRPRRSCLCRALQGMHVFAQAANAGPQQVTDMQSALAWSNQTNPSSTTDSLALVPDVVPAKYTCEVQQPSASLLP